MVKRLGEAFTVQVWSQAGTAFQFVHRLRRQRSVEATHWALTTRATKTYWTASGSFGKEFEARISYETDQPLE